MFSPCKFTFWSCGGNNDQCTGLANFDQSFDSILGKSIVK